ncbi:hypothetical protein BerOc1_02379 [Pseudodesulfovibrio hydrargyri]|uniref:Uncharacterized protein n=1 Tax=Pseudodesulfovibrio hydrargyri TaxID=2125990 RepID=A0A1J5MWV7_9BACT|nr:hypothetical protein [Pseudodesulfovibrio hydrargyri]OIQ50442.1 hypothetical protein BerOc1_02379 [Pseudodesulfovibrio hydrargyri]
MDNDSIMLEELGTSVILMQQRYRNAPLADWPDIQGKLQEAMAQYVLYQAFLLKQGTISTAQDIAAMQDIKKEIDQAAETQKLVAAISRFAVFIASKVI